MIRTAIIDGKQFYMLLSVHTEMELKYKHYNKIADSEWAMYFETTPESHPQVYSWFETCLSYQDFTAGWRSDKTNITVFLHNEKALSLAILRWS